MLLIKVTSLILYSDKKIVCRKFNLRIKTENLKYPIFGSPSSNFVKKYQKILSVQGDNFKMGQTLRFMKK